MIRPPVIRRFLAAVCAVLALFALALPAAAAPRLMVGLGPFDFERFQGQPFFTTRVAVRLQTTESTLRWRLSGLPAWATASATSGVARRANQYVVLELRLPASGVIADQRVALVFTSSAGDRVTRSLSIRTFGDRTAGAMTFANRCRGCHLPDGRGNAPILFGVYGRTAGSLTGYAFSAALRAYGQRWTHDRLTRWLTNPPAVVPGTRMGANVVAGLTAKQRRDIVAYLRAISIR